MSCPICEKRKPTRYCPAKGETICAVCCGTGREVTIDCVPDCSYLVAAHRYEGEHPRAIPADMPLLKAEIRGDIHHTHAQLSAAILHNIAQFCVSQPDTRDADVLLALQALAETYKTLCAGIYYEKPPDGRLAAGLYTFLQEFLRKVKEEPGNAARGHARAKDGEIFQLLVLLYRHSYFQSNGRPLSRRFIEFVRLQFPDSQQLKKPESRIIVP